MAINSGPNIVTNGLIFYMDPTNIKSYPGTGLTYSDLTGKNYGRLTYTPGIGTMSYNPILNCFDAQGATATSNTFISTINPMTFTDASEYTMEFAVKLNSGTLDTTFQSLCGNGQTNPIVLVSGSSASWQMAFRQSGAGVYSYSTMVNNYNIADNWALLSMTVQTNRTINFYLNGSLISAASPTPVTTLLTVSRLAGGYSSGGFSYPWQGLVSHIRFYNRTLSDNEIYQNYQATKTSIRFAPNVVTNGLSFYVDTANTNSFTKTTNGWNDMTENYGTLALSGAYYDSSNGGIITFDGNAGSSASKATTFIQSTGMTWDVWFNRTESTNTYNMVWSNNNLPYFSFLSTGRFLFSWYTTLSGNINQRTIYSPLNTYTNGIWYNVTCTLVQDTTTGLSTGKMYVNGQLVETNTPPSPLLDNVYQAGRLIVANYSNNGIYPFKGSISNLRIYKRVLTDSEILQNYNALKARFGY